MASNVISLRRAPVQLKAKFEIPKDYSMSVMEACICAGIQPNDYPFGSPSTLLIPTYGTHVYDLKIGTEGLVESVDLSEICGTADLITAVPLTELDTILANIAQTANLTDDDESAPVPAVVEKASNLITQASRLMATQMPEGAVSTFYGEINITWRNGDDIVRVACFPNRSTILQFGNLSQPLGSYQSHAAPSAQDVATRLDALNLGATR